MGADSPHAVAAKLEQMGCLPVSIMPVVKASGVSISLPTFARVGFTDLNMFTMQLYTLLRAGVPLLGSLSALKAQTANPYFKDVLTQVMGQVEAGANFSSALAQHPNVFSALFTNMIKSGEVSGKLPEILDRLATLGAHEEKIRQKIKAAVRYPVIVVFAICVAFVILILFVIPRFAQIYSQFKTELPLPTRLLIAIHYGISHYWWLGIIILAGAIFFLRQFIATPVGRKWWDSVKIHVPIFGPLLMNVIISRFCRITGTLMRSGVPILQILDLVEENMGNVVVSRAIMDIKKSVNEGKGMLEPMRQSGLFTVVVLQMVAVGEETGKLDELLLHVSEHYDAQVDLTVSNLVSLIEPILIFFLGGMALFMALGIFMPMWDMMKLFQQ